MKELYGKTLRVHQVDLNDPNTIPVLPATHQHVGTFQAVPVTGVRLVDIKTGQPIPQGALVLVYKKTNVL